MLVVVSDTHRRDGHGLEGPLATAAATADRVVHAGDFTTPAVVDAFRDTAARLDAVHGNADTAGVRERLPSETTTTYNGARIVVVHRPESGETGLAMRGRARDADLVVFGHTHCPTVIDAGAVTLLNPGSHTRPRGNRPGYATLEPTATGLAGQLRDLNGNVVEPFTVEGEARDRPSG